MRSRLSIRCDLIADESVPSWISRLAACNRVGSAYEFCLDMGMSFQACVMGRPEALRTLGELTGTPVAALERASLIPTGPDFMLRGERLSRRALRRLHVHACPVCLSQSSEADGAVQPSPPYGRTLWQLSVIRTCPEHTCALVPIAKSEANAAHDFTQNVRGRRDEIRRLAAHPIARHPSALETYVADRLEGRSTNAPWLDQHDLPLAISTCELLGTSIMLGPSVQFGSLTEADLHRVGQAGFEAAREGEPGIRAALRKMQTADRARKLGGPKSIFGAIYRSATQSRRNANLEPLRDLLRRHILETTPVGPSDVIMGCRVEKRVLHSISTAARETGRTPQRIRKIVAAAGLIASDHVRHSNNNVLFDAEKARALLEAETEQFKIKDIAEYLGSGTQRVYDLIDQGLIKPSGSYEISGIMKLKTFARSEVDRFMGRLHQGAERVDAYDAPFYNLLEATKRCHCSATDVVGLIIDRKLSWIGHDPSKTGYNSVIVDTKEIKSLLYNEKQCGISIDEARKILGTSLAVVVSLLENRYLFAQTTFHPITRCPMRMIEKATIELFREQYVSLTEISRTKKMHHRHVKDALRNIKPAIEKSLVQATYYRRDEIRDLLS